MNTLIASAPQPIQDVYCGDPCLVERLPATGFDALWLVVGGVGLLLLGVATRLSVRRGR